MQAGVQVGNQALWSPGRLGGFIASGAREDRSSPGVRKKPSADKGPDRLDLPTRPFLRASHDLAQSLRVKLPRFRGAFLHTLDGLPCRP